MRAAAAQRGTHTLNWLSEKLHVEVLVWPCPEQVQLMSGVEHAKMSGEDSAAGVLMHV